MPQTDTIKSQAANRTSCHASHRYKQITGNKSYILPCLTQISANHRQQIVHLTLPHTDTSKSQATNRTSSNASYRYQKITGHLANKSYILPCPTLMQANHSQQVVLLALPHTDTSKSHVTNSTSCHASHTYQQITGNKSYILPCLTQRPANHRQQIVHLTMPHTETSTSQATNRTSCHASHTYQQITGNKSYFLPCRTHRHQQATGNKSYILECFIQIPENHRPSCQQIVHLAMPHTDTCKSQAILPTNRKPCHASR